MRTVLKSKWYMVLPGHWYKWFGLELSSFCPKDFPPAARKSRNGSFNHQTTNLSELSALSFPICFSSSLFHRSALVSHKHFISPKFKQLMGSNQLVEIMNGVAQTTRILKLYFTMPQIWNIQGFPFIDLTFSRAASGYVHSLETPYVCNELIS